jgi:hypothetical protein
LGLTANEEEIQEITKRVKQEGIMRKGVVTDFVFMNILNRVRNRKTS